MSVFNKILLRPFSIRPIFLSCALSLLLSFALTRSFAQENIVPNPSFEQYSNAPIGWYYKGEHFTETMKFWSSPTGASPDAYSPKVVVPANWAEKDFGKMTAHSGTSMIGMTTYGCSNGKPHCREYVQILLNERLIVGQTYAIEFWANHLPRSLQINKLGAFFSTKRFDTKTDAPLPNIKPQFFSSKVINASKGWQKVAGTFKANNEGDYLILGNFFSDTLTQTAFPARKDFFNYAYYYIDDVVVKKLPPFLTVPVQSDDLTKISVTVGKSVTLKDIYFDHDKAELLPRSFVELRKLLYLLRKNPKMSIELQGHTDNNGTPEHNQTLSEDRAQAVTNFLLYNSIEKKRIKSKGFGETKPIATNETEDGRQLNRRVMFVIVTK
jgi:OmpA-OmpF porin, OOP family